MTAVQQGGTYVPMTFVFAREIVKMLQREKITGMAGVPTLWSLMAQPSSSLGKHDRSPFALHHEYWRADAANCAKRPAQCASRYANLSDVRANRGIPFDLSAARGAGSSPDIDGEGYP